MIQIWRSYLKQVLSYRADKQVIDTHRHTHGHTEPKTIPEGQNWPRGKIHGLLSIYTSNVLPKFQLDIRGQTKVRVWKLKKSNMATRQPFWKWHNWKLIGFYPNTQVFYWWSLELILCSHCLNIQSILSAALSFSPCVACILALERVAVATFLPMNPYSTSSARINNRFKRWNSAVTSIRMLAPCKMNTTCKPTLALWLAVLLVFGAVD